MGTKYTTEKGAKYNLDDGRTKRNGKPHGEASVYLDPILARNLYQSAKSENVPPYPEVFTAGHYEKPGGIILTRMNTTSFYWSSVVTERIPPFSGLVREIKDEDKTVDGEVDLGKLADELPADPGYSNDDQTTIVGGDFSGWDFGGMTQEEILEAMKSGKKPKKKKKRWFGK